MSGVYIMGKHRLLKVGESSERYEDSSEARVTLKNPTEFYRSLAFLYRSGHPLSNSFKLLATGLETEPEKVACLKVYAHIRSGRNVAESFKLAGFAPTLVAAVRAGEQSGRLDDALDWYAEFEERNQQVKRELKQAMLYPAITLGFSLTLAVLLPPFVLHDQLAILAHSGAEMPFLSKLLFWFSGAVTHPATLLLIPLVFFLFSGLRAFTQLTSGRRMLEQGLQRIPFVSDGLRRAACSRALGLLALLLRAGLPTAKALELAGEGCGSMLLREKLALAGQALVGGFDVQTSLGKVEWFLPATHGLISAGEHSGDLAPMVELSAHVEEDKLREALAALAAVIQPFLFIFVGAIVCLTILAVLGPSMSLLSGL